ncbi:MAG: hypothetical protein KDK72_04735 [Chlamydiia bacterium]|nr:hypothetical protein [Chlamydiia bacterium]
MQWAPADQLRQYLQEHGIIDASGDLCGDVGDLPFPIFTNKERERIKGSIDFPLFIEKKLCAIHAQILNIICDLVEKNETGYRLKEKINLAGFLKKFSAVYIQGGRVVELLGPDFYRRAIVSLCKHKGVPVPEALLNEPLLGSISRKAPDTDIYVDISELEGNLTHAIENILREWLNEELKETDLVDAIISGFFPVKEYVRQSSNCDDLVYCSLPIQPEGDRPIDICFYKTYQWESGRNTCHGLRLPILTENALELPSSRENWQYLLDRLLCRAHVLDPDISGEYGWAIHHAFEVRNFNENSSENKEALAKQVEKTEDKRIESLLWEQIDKRFPNNPSAACAVYFQAWQSLGSRGLTFKLFDKHIDREKVEAQDPVVLCLIDCIRDHETSWDQIKAVMNFVANRQQKNNVKIHRRMKDGIEQLQFTTSDVNGGNNIFIPVMVEGTVDTSSLPPSVRKLLSVASKKYLDIPFEEQHSYSLDDLRSVERWAQHCAKATQGKVRLRTNTFEKVPTSVIASYLQKVKEKEFSGNPEGSALLFFNAWLSFEHRADGKQLLKKIQNKLGNLPLYFKKLVKTILAQQSREKTKTVLRAIKAAVHFVEKATGEKIFLQGGTLCLKGEADEQTLARAELPNELMSVFFQELLKDKKIVNDVHVEMALLLPWLADRNDKNLLLLFHDFLYGDEDSILKYAADNFGKHPLDELLIEAALFSRDSKELSLVALLWEKRRISFFSYIKALVESDFPVAEKLFSKYIHEFKSQEKAIANLLQEMIDRKRPISIFLAVLGEVYKEFSDCLSEKMMYGVQQVFDSMQASDVLVIMKKLRQRHGEILADHLLEKLLENVSDTSVNLALSVAEKGTNRESKKTLLKQIEQRNLSAEQILRCREIENSERRAVERIQELIKNSLFNEAVDQLVHTAVENIDKTELVAIINQLTKKVGADVIKILKMLNSSCVSQYLDMDNKAALLITCLKSDEISVASILDSVVSTFLYTCTIPQEYPILLQHLIKVVHDNGLSLSKPTLNNVKQWLEKHLSVISKTLDDDSKRHVLHLQEIHGWNLHIDGDSVHDWHFVFFERVKEYLTQNRLNKAQKEMRAMQKQGFLLTNENYVELAVVASQYIGTDAAVGICEAAENDCYSELLKALKKKQDYIKITHLLLKLPHRPVWKDLCDQILPHLTRQGEMDLEVCDLVIKYRLVKYFHTCMEHLERVPDINYLNKAIDLFLFALAAIPAEAPRGSSEEGSSETNPSESAESSRLPEANSSGEKTPAGIAVALGDGTAFNDQKFLQQYWFKILITVTAVLDFRAVPISSCKKMIDYSESYLNNVLLCCEGNRPLEILHVRHFFSAILRSITDPKNEIELIRKISRHKNNTFKELLSCEEDLDQARFDQLYCVTLCSSGDPHLFVEGIQIALSLLKNVSIPEDCEVIPFKAFLACLSNLPDVERNVQDEKEIKKLSETIKTIYVDETIIQYSFSSVWVKKILEVCKVCQAPDLVAFPVPIALMYIHMEYQHENRHQVDQEFFAWLEQFVVHSPLSVCNNFFRRQDVNQYLDVHCNQGASKYLLSLNKRIALFARKENDIEHLQGCVNLFTQLVPHFTDDHELFFDMWEIIPDTYIQLLTHEKMDSPLNVLPLATEEVIGTFAEKVFKDVDQHIPARMLLWRPMAPLQWIKQNIPIATMTLWLQLFNNLEGVTLGINESCNFSDILRLLSRSDERDAFLAKVKTEKKNWEAVFKNGILKGVEKINDFLEFSFDYQDENQRALILIRLPIKELTQLKGLKFKTMVPPIRSVRLIDNNVAIDFQVDYAEHVVGPRYRLSFTFFFQFMEHFINKVLDNHKLYVTVEQRHAVFHTVLPYVKDLVTQYQKVDYIENIRPRLITLLKKTVCSPIWMQDEGLFTVAIHQIGMLFAGSDQGGFFIDDTETYFHLLNYVLMTVNIRDPWTLKSSPKQKHAADVIRELIHHNQPFATRLGFMLLFKNITTYSNPEEFLQKLIERAKQWPDFAIIKGPNSGMLEFAKELCTTKELAPPIPANQDIRSLKFEYCDLAILNLDYYPQDIIPKESFFVTLGNDILKIVDDKHQLGLTSRQTAIIVCDYIRCLCEIYPKSRKFNFAKMACSVLAQAVMKGAFTDYEELYYKLLITELLPVVLVWGSMKGNHPYSIKHPFARMNKLLVEVKKDVPSRETAKEQWIDILGKMKDDESAVKAIEHLEKMWPLFKPAPAKEEKKTTAPSVTKRRRKKKKR